ncbi:uncharacterized protein L3040_009451 [Drepanopeziza brunnea f. sp. 'multigermtubi']|uniref:Uncharacterized protein n=1 Tax=Marssonina brunnea f. sp. multigermtubi (strain MB_m1) TaxID=1072389 RepID=K1WTC1_MARBU|nr:uncharacterized protein MBM_05610 [Drepanopeziza brunnea f. sp. 'multigermtubi' MB_m1]EKD16316.1 hypothetical protein MBM_05610 [Drepanopeziza brunnea f. sp. 'multigermtubi' MB_m1]KAJ5032860.1 hypothetical protein L3040_009451 [Drepanopeziza brunnea f. sp. 'multigermtubi']
MATEPAITGDSQSIFEELENYPWDSDRKFQGGLSAILGPNPSPSQLEDLTLRAQCFYLSRQKGISIDFDAYKAYLARKEPSTSNQTTTLTSSTSTAPSAPPPANDTTTPTGASNDPKMAVSSTPTDPSSMNNSATGFVPAGTGPPNPGAPYPASFAEIVAMIQAGKEIPGYIEVSERVIGWENATPPVLPKRRKPWEKDVPEEIIQGKGPGCFGDERDLPEIKQVYPEGV